VKQKCCSNTGSDTHQLERNFRLVSWHSEMTFQVALTDLCSHSNQLPILLYPPSNGLVLSDCIVYVTLTLRNASVFCSRGESVRFAYVTSLRVEGKK
jgi:hypothetical protein